MSDYVTAEGRAIEDVPSSYERKVKQLKDALIKIQKLSEKKLLDKSGSMSSIDIILLDIKEIASKAVKKAYHG